MNKEIALILLARLAGATYLDRTSGVVQVIEKFDQTEDGLRIVKRLPYSHSATLQDCNTMDKAMIPNSKYKSCLYFEESGTTPIEQRGAFQMYSSRLRLVCWLNMKTIAGMYSELNTPKIMADIIYRITKPEPIANENFMRLKAKVEGIPPQDKNIFSDYDYDEQASQYLMPPFDFFAIDFRVEFSVPDCTKTLITADLTGDPCANALTA